MIPHNCGPQVCNLSQDIKQNHNSDVNQGPLTPLNSNDIGLFFFFINLALGYINVCIKNDQNPIVCSQIEQNQNFDGDQGL